MALNKNALTSCPSCGEMISGTAAKCPKCGNERRLIERLTKLQLLAGSAVAIGALLTVHPDGSDGLGLLMVFVGIVYYAWSFRRKND